MKIKIKGVTFSLLGDPHLGRRFVNGVPLHRRGDREKMVWNTFKNHLDDIGGVDAHVCMGDLFNLPRVDNAVVARAADEYQLCAALNNIPYFVLTGNHDEMRDADFVSSFHLFTRIVDRSIKVIRKEVQAHTIGDAQVAFIPWHPLKTAAEMVEEYADVIQGADAVFGHWDVDRRLEGSSNYVPAERLRELGVGVIITGHDHVARETTVAGVRTIVTGSMQPYSHSEDKDGDIYVTHTAEDALQLLTVEPRWFLDKSLRVRGDWPHEIPDCLQFQVVPAEGDLSVDEALEQVRLQQFDMKQLWKEAFEGVDETIETTLKEKFLELEGELE
jgi:DNA repair exonuclease SbcCD nuclease subunit